MYMSKSKQKNQNGEIDKKEYKKTKITLKRVSHVLQVFRGSIYFSDIEIQYEKYHLKYTIYMKHECHDIQTAIKMSHPSLFYLRQGV